MAESGFPALSYLGLPLGSTFKVHVNEHDKIRELSQQLAIEKKRAATYKRHLEMIFDHIEEHNESLSKKIQYIVDSVKEIEMKEQKTQR
ncbi:hypothetical protein FH972_015175 [Carpinus fangiana]|uniref:Uncharacterized protein n=1 Tax=Carpinus fangiana TaxID=176857 RepID=A0A5N6RCA0_9ROSI|nr:hypothetical protein FH972_015175 [Carpinus fangiana]